MKNNRSLHLAILLLFAIGLYGVSGLVLDEFQTGDGCPKLIGIPACIIIFICFFIPLVSHLLKKWNVLYFVFTGIAVSIALIASILQYLDKAQCPKLEDGTPMCYYSLLIFAGLIGLKIVAIRQSTISDST